MNSPLHMRQQQRQPEATPPPPRATAATGIMAALIQCRLSLQATNILVSPSPPSAECFKICVISSVGKGNLTESSGMA